MRIRRHVVDLTDFTDIVEAALLAFAADHRYAAAMARRAVRIQLLRERRRGFRR